jgi:hypothetical protein
VKEHLSAPDPIIDGVGQVGHQEPSNGGRHINMLIGVSGFSFVYILHNYIVVVERLFRYFYMHEERPEKESSSTQWQR